MNPERAYVESTPEEDKRFSEFIKLEKDLSPNEVIKTLCEFHNENPEELTEKFTHLKQYLDQADSDDIIEIKDKRNTTNGMFQIYCTKKDGSYRWYINVDENGNPMPIIG